MNLYDTWNKGVWKRCDSKDAWNDEIEEKEKGVWESPVHEISTVEVLSYDDIVDPLKLIQGNSKDYFKLCKDLSYWGKTLVNVYEFVKMCIESNESMFIYHCLNNRVSKLTKKEYTKLFALSLEKVSGPKIDIPVIFINSVFNYNKNREEKLNPLVLFLVAYHMKKAFVCVHFVLDDLTKGLAVDARENVIRKYNEALAGTFGFCSQKERPIEKSKQEREKEYSLFSGKSLFTFNL